jgi:pantoate kinase
MTKAPKNLQAGLRDLSWVAKVLPEGTYTPALDDLQNPDLAECLSNASQVDALQTQLATTQKQLAVAKASEGIVNGALAMVGEVVLALEERKIDVQQAVTEVRAFSYC